MMKTTGTGGADLQAVERALDRFFATVVARESLGRILVALSGGPDSVALLRATVDHARPRGVDVAACWVDHAIRPEPELEAERTFVRSLCESLGVPLVIESARRGAILASAVEAGGVEAAARNFRYQALERARARLDCGMVLTGHTADDAMETMVMRFFTGSGASGLRGIPERNGYIARPLLSVTKADGLAYLSALGQPYRVDSTNAGDDYLRNRIRHELMPALLSIFPACGTALTTVAHKMRLDDDALSAEAAALRAIPAPGGAAGDMGAIDGVRFDQAAPAARMRALYQLACDHGSERLPWRMIRMASMAVATDGRLAAGSGMEFVRSDNRIVARPLREPLAHAGGAAMDGFAIRIDGVGSFRIGKAAGCRVYSSDVPPGLRLDSFEWPLWLRTRRPGDAIATACGLKMIDALLSERRRATGRPVEAVIVEDRAGIVAVLPGDTVAPGNTVAPGDGEWQAVFRRNDHLIATRPAGFLVFDLKGVVRTDAV